MTIGNAGWLFGGIAIGSSIGVGVTYIYMKDKFEKKLNEEVTALKTHYVERDRQLARKNEEAKKELEEKLYSSDELKEFVDYTNKYIKPTDEVSEPDIDYSSAAQIISDVDWDDPDYDDYKKISVDYFEDGAVFETLSGEELDSFELIVGNEWKDSFGEYTPNVVYVRNDDLRTDYEIIEQEGSSPHPEDE